MENWVALLNRKNHGVHFNLDHPGKLHTARWSPNGEMIAAGGYMPEVWLWDAQSGVMISKLANPFGGNFNLFNIIWNKAGDKLLAYDDLTGFHVWDVHTGENLLSAKHHDQSSERQYEEGVYSAVWNSDETRILASSQNSVRVWDLRLKQDLAQYHDKLLTFNIEACWNSDESRVMVGGYNEAVCLFDAGLGGGDG